MGILEVRGNVLTTPDGYTIILGEAGEHRLEPGICSDVIRSLRSGGDPGFAERPSPEVRAAIEELVAAEILERVAPTDPASVQIIAATREAGDHLSAILRADGGDVTSQAELQIALAADYLDPSIWRLIDCTKRALFAKVQGRVLWLGPVLRPGAAPCPECIQFWLRLNRPIASALTRSGYLPFPEAPACEGRASTLHAGLGWVATEVQAILAGKGDPRLLGGILTWDTRTSSRALHPINPSGRCRCCGAEPEPRRYDLTRFVSPITGVVQQMETTEAPVCGVYLARARAANPLSADPARAELGSDHHAGRGFKRDQAEVGCVAESLERYSMAYQGTEEMVRGAFGELEGAIDPASLLLYSGKQYASREIRNRDRADSGWVDEPLPAEHLIRWVKASPLGAGNPAFVPAGCAYLYYPCEDEPRYASGDSNGCALSTSYAQGLESALLELIERDAVAIWWYNRLRRPPCPPEAWADEGVQAIRQGTEQEQGRSFRLLDLTTDLQVPVAVAISAEKDGSFVVLGAAAAKDWATAARRASSEMCQVWFWNRRGRPHPSLEPWLRMSNLVEHAYLETEESVRALPARDLAENSIPDLLERLRAAGLSAWWIDLTRPEIGLPAVRVVVPGLRPHWRRLAPGRLYDVPVHAGWLAEASREEDLNPWECPL